MWQFWSDKTGVLQMHKFHHNLPGSRFLIFIIGVAMSVMLFGTLAGCGDDADESEDSASQTTAAGTNTKQERIATDDYVMELAVRRIGDPALVRTAKVTEDGTGKVVTVDIGRPYTCHDGAVVGEVALFTQQVMGMLFQDPAVQKIDISMYGSTEAVETSDEIAMTVSVDRATSDTIDWFDFDEQNMLQLVTSYYLHPNIQQSYSTEGGSTEGTIDQLQQSGAVPAT